MQIIIKIIKKSIVFLINLLVMVLSILIPKSPNIVVVGGWFGQRFADNSKHFYLYANQGKEQLNLRKVIWITKSKNIETELKCQGYEVYMTWSIKSIWWHLRAKNHFIDQSPIDINSWFSIRSNRINLWHGFPLKKIGTYMGGSQFSKKTKLQKFITKLSTRGFWSDHYLLSPSQFASEILGKAFDVDINKVIISGYPRNYEPLVTEPIKYISQNEKKEYDMIQDLKDKGYKIIGYLPTFRDKKETLIFGTDDPLELGNFLNFCEESKAKIVGKFHFAGKNDKFENINQHEAFIDLPSEADVYTFLSQIDILITDYSSIYFDFLLWEKPIIFFPYDLEYYRDEDRGLIFDYDEYTSGPKVYDLYELKTLLQQEINDFEKYYNEKYSIHAKEIKEKVFSKNPEKMMIKYLYSQFKK